MTGNPYYDICVGAAALGLIILIVRTVRTL